MRMIFATIIAIAAPLAAMPARILMAKSKSGNRP